MYKNALGTWQVIGVGHGGGSAATASSNNFSLVEPVCSADTLENADNVAAASTRFVDAPRFASNVAVHRSPYSPSATAVFAVDSDLNRVVYRYRQGTSPTYTSKFTYWKNLGAPSLRGGAKLSRIAACSANAAGSPQVFVVANQSSIYTRSANSLGQWSAWSLFALWDGGVLDLDAATDSSGRCLLFMVSNGGGAFVRARTSDTTWGNWVKVAGGSYKAVTALYYPNKVWAALLDTSGEVWRTTPGRIGWTAPVKLTRPAGVSAWRDIDLTWDEAARGFMVAVPSAAGATSKLWFTPLYGDMPWGAWYYFSTSLWAPGQRIQPSPSLRSITASRWMEDPAGTTTPVIFGTDERGNVYLIHYSNRLSVWDLRWKSFYHETVPSP
jgi:hypothetical protein